MLNIRLKTIFYTTIVSCLLASFFTEASVSVLVNNKPLHFTEQPRLADVLKEVAFEENWYWPASKLFRAPSEHIEHKRRVVLRHIAKVQGSSHPQLSAQLGLLAEEIRIWQLAERVFIKIDYDLARIQLKHNPKLTSGQYILSLVTRPNSIVFLGATASPIHLNHRPASPINSYLDSLTMSPFADSQRLFVFSNNIEAEEVSSALWNKEHVELMPGAVVFLPFAESMFSSDLSALNNMLLDLIKHRVN